MESYIQDLINNRVDEIKKEENVYMVGRVSKIQDYILEVRGLEDVTYFEEVNIGTFSRGYVNAILPNCVNVAVVKQVGDIFIGDEVVAIKKEFMTDYSEDSIGNVIDMFGVDKMCNMEFANLIKLHLQEPAVPIMERSPVCRPLHTGIAGIDLIYPIGRGQRQLIIGDKKTGKTQIALDTIVNLLGNDILCIYVAIGKTKKAIKEMYYDLKRRGAMEYTTIICAFNDDLPTVLSLTPFAALSIAEHYMKQGRDVLVVIDDMKRHADAYREISLLSGRIPGREAYPPDIFYLHARLLEKGCQRRDGGSISILPIVETKGGDITDYISTNIISITDGQIVLSKKNFDKGEKPAIDYGLSVSRLGGAVQNREIKRIGAIIRRELLSYLEKREVYELANTDEMSLEIRELLSKGRIILECLNQYKFEVKNEADIIKLFQEIIGE